MDKFCQIWKNKQKSTASLAPFKTHKRSLKGVLSPCPKPKPQAAGRKGGIIKPVPVHEKRMEHPKQNCQTTKFLETWTLSLGLPRGPSTFWHLKHGRLDLNALWLCLYTVCFFEWTLTASGFNVLVSLENHKIKHTRTKNKSGPLKKGYPICQHPW